MFREPQVTHSEQQSGCSRRRFLGGALAVAASGPLLGASASAAVEQAAAEAKPATFDRKIKLGLVGCGGRGSWIAKLFQQHGGYDLHAVTDYFQDVADRCGDALGVDKGRRFSGLSGYKKVIESGVDAVALIVPPYCLPEHASAAVEAGVHVYMAKPVAVDVPGCLRVESAAKQATQKKQVFLVDYQMPTDPAIIKVAERIHTEGLGPLAKVRTVGVTGGHIDPPKTATIEDRLQNAVWTNDVALGGGHITSYDIHALDAAVWILGRRPVKAMGDSRICRANPHGDNHDSTSVIYEYADGLLHEHSGIGLPNGAANELSCRIYGRGANAMVDYYTNVYFHRRFKKAFTAAPVVDLYPAGAKRNIAAFYQDVTGGHSDNPTAQRAVDSCLTCILGREAALRHGQLTMEELLKENKAFEADLRGLKV